MEQEKSQPSTITVEELKEMNESVKHLVQQNKIFAMQKLQGNVRYGRISLRDNKLYLHHLCDEEPPPPDACVIDFQDTLKLVDSSSRVAFLDLENSGTTLVQLTIRLSPDTKGAQNFAVLCTGEKGPSYAKTKLFEVHHRGRTWEYVGGGDYEYNNGDGGKALLPGLELGPEYEREFVPGIVRGFWGLGDNVGAQFFISTGTDYAGKISPAFGVVEEGLESLRRTVQISHPISIVSVSDCGLVLNC